MALPSSGQISYGDIRTETITTARNSYSIAKAAWTSGSYTLLEYPAINMGSTSKPNINQPATVSEWYGYDHTYALSVPGTGSNLASRSPNTPYSDMYVFDLGTTNGTVDITLRRVNSSANTIQISGEYGYPYDTSGNAVGGPGGTLFSSGLINSSTYTTSFTYTYNAGYGQKMYVYADAISSTAGWPTYDVEVSAVNTGFDVQLYSSAGDVSSDEYNLFYKDGSGGTWIQIAGPLSSTSCQTLSSVNISSGTIYIKAERDSNASQIYIRGANSSTCPANLAVTCEYSATITGNEDVAITVAVESGDFVDC